MNMAACRRRYPWMGSISRTLFLPGARRTSALDFQRMGLGSAGDKPPKPEEKDD